MRRLLISLVVVLPLIVWLLPKYANANLRLRLDRQHTHTGQVRSLAICGQWVLAATSGGLAVHSSKSGRLLRKLTSADGLPGNSLKSVTCFRHGQALVGGEFGAAVVQLHSRWRALPVVGLGAAKRYSPVTSLLTLSSQETRLVVMQYGLMRLVGNNPDQAARVEANSQVPTWWHTAACGPTHCALGDLAGLLVVLPRGDLDSLQTSLVHAGRFVLDDPIIAVQAQQDHFVVATGQTLLRIEKSQVRALTVLDTLGRSDRVRATALARAGQALLVGTADGVVYKLQGDRLTQLASTAHSPITALAADGRRIWLGLGRLGLHVIEPQPSRPKVKSLRPPAEICDNHVTRLTRHRGWLIAGTFDHGACVLTSKGWLPLRGLPSQMVLGLASDGSNLYVATASGIARYGRRLQPRPIGRRDAKTLQWLASQPATGAAELGVGRVALTSRYGVLRIWSRSRGRTRVRLTKHDQGAPWKMTGVSQGGDELFAFSETQGVVRLDVGGLPEWHLTDPRPLSENWVTSVAALSAEQLWVGTCQRGVVYVNGPSAIRFGKQNGLPDERITAVAANSQGAFVATLNGLAFTPPNNRGQVQTWHLSDGLPDPRSAGLLLEKDMLWVATEAGLARFGVISQALAQR